MRLSKGIEGLIGNYQRILDRYLKGVDLQTPAKAQHTLGGNFDGPICDLGLRAALLGASARPPTHGLMASSDARRRRVALERRGRSG